MVELQDLGLSTSLKGKRAREDDASGTVSANPPRHSLSSGIDQGCPEPTSALRASVSSPTSVLMSFRGKGYCKAFWIFLCFRQTMWGLWRMQQN